MVSLLLVASRAAYPPIVSAEAEAVQLLDDAVEECSQPRVGDAAPACAAHSCGARKSGITPTNVQERH
jgi:hypothetical protein